jgi:lysozyme
VGGMMTFIPNNVEGIDVSGWNGNTNWQKVKQSGRDFCFIKATQGLTYLNPHFKTDWANSKIDGLIHGAYHYFMPSDNAEMQAQWFLKNIGLLTKSDLPAVLDWEFHTGNYDEEIKNALIWLTIVHKETGKKPIIYSNPSYIDSLSNPESLINYPLWLAQWASKPTIPKPWSGYSFWQYSDTGVVPGVPGQCDLNVGGGDISWLIEFCQVT